MAAMALCLSLTACGGSGSSGGSGGNGAQSQAAGESDGSGTGGPSDQSGTPGEPGQNGAAEYKDTLTVGTTAQPPTLDPPITSSNVAAGIAMNIYESLYMMNKDYEPVPVLAESSEISGDGLVYTFHLRQGVKFHNGKEMTAGDVEASMNRWLEMSSKAKVLLAGSKFDEVDTYTVKFTVPQASSDILSLIASPNQFAAISPKEIVESASAEGIQEYVGTGPYKLQEWKMDQYIHLVRNEDYQPVDGEASGFVGKKAAATENIIFRFVTDHATRIAGIETGEYDIVEDVPLERYEELAGIADVKLYTRTDGTLNLFLNTTEGPLKNQTMRQAVLAALNDEEIMMASFVNTDLYQLNPGYMNLQQPQWAVESGAEYYNQNNLEKAKSLLAEAGYKGETIRLLTTPDYQEMYNATLVAQAELTQAGVKAEVETYDFPVFMEHKSNTSQWDLFITSNSYALTPPQLSVLNPDWAGLTAPEVAKGIDAMRFAANEEEARAAWSDLQQFLYEYGAASVLGHYSSAVAARISVEGFDYFRYPVYWNVKAAK